MTPAELNEEGLSYELAGDASRALARYREAHASGLVSATVRLAYLYWFGFGVQVDREGTAKSLFERAMHAHPLARAECLLERWGGLERDDTQAVKLMRQAIAAGMDVLHAQTLLGWCYQAARGVPHDGKQAFDLLSECAERGFLPAKVRLANCFMEGE